MTPVRKIWIITCLSASLLMSDVSLGAEESLTYDVDGDGVQSSFTDGILIIRYLFGFSGNALISGVVGDGATRATAESIEAYIAGLSAQLDLDGDSEVKPLTDGLLFIRAMAGACDTTGVVGASATRTTCTDILSFANLTFPKLSDLGFGSNKENELTLSVSQQTDNPSRLNFRYSYQGEESLLGFAIWIFYDSTQVTGPSIFETEQATTGIILGSDPVFVSSSGRFRNNLDVSNLDDDVSTDNFLAYLYFPGEVTVEQQSEALWSESFAMDFGSSITTTSVLSKVVSVSSNVSVSQPNAVEISRLDTDTDGVIDYFDTFPLDATETVDTDSDGVGDNADTDDDADGVSDGSDAFPLDATETLDTDSDGTGNNADTDDDGDGVADDSDAFPLDSNESLDTDSDGTGNNADTDDDGDGENDPISQMGSDFDGTSPGGNFGTVALSADGSVFAVGAFGADSAKGVVEVYSWNPTFRTWSQVGADIVGDNFGDVSGYSLALSDDGTRLAIGTVSSSGPVRVFEWDGTAWSLLGDGISGDFAGDYFGLHVDLSADGEVLVATAPLNDSNGENSGQAKIFSWDSQSLAWVQLGDSITGEGTEDRMGAFNVSLSSTGQTVAIGAWKNDGSGDDSGHTRVFDWDGSQWSQRGSDIDGAAAGDRSGTSVGISSDGNIVAIGEPFHDVTNENAGRVRVYEWSESDTTWLQKGQNIEGEVAVCEEGVTYSDSDGDGVTDSCGDESGWSSSLSGDGLVLAIGAWKNDGNGDRSGHTRIYAWRDQTNRWEQVGEDLDGERSGDQSGWKTKLSRDGTVLAVGAFGNDDGGANAGHARVFEILKDGDAFPLDATESIDTDFDGTGNNADTDDDNDGVLDAADAFALISLGTLTDTDGDGRPNACDSDCQTLGMTADPDDDNDGVADSSDIFPLDATETLDTDSDGTGNNADTDDDGDGVADSADALPLDATETLDTDADGKGNNADTDDDGDGVADSADAFPLDATETLDTDADSTGNNADTDDDGDGVPDTSDAFPLDVAETLDTDNDGTGNNADTDDDNDGVLDAADAFALISLGSLTDTDGDGRPNDCDSDCVTLGMTADTDDDGDGVADGADIFPLDATETVDTDSDGIGNNADADDDGDGVADTADGYPLISLGGLLDTDSDGFPNDCDQGCLAIGITADSDDDNDGVADIDDFFPLDAAESSDRDGDGVGDNSDAFPDNLDETVDSDVDGIGDNSDNCPNMQNSDQTNTDGDLFGNACDLDDDNDGFTDAREEQDGTDPLNRFSCKSGCFSFDVDENLEAKPLTDGLLVIRHLFGFSGESLTSGAVSGEANRGSSEVIAGYLTDANSELDIDGDGESKPLTDGLLLIRYLFGFSGDSLVSGAIGEGAERDTADEVEAYIEERIPGH